MWPNPQETFLCSVQTFSSIDLLKKLDVLWRFYINTTVCVAITIVNNFDNREIQVFCKIVWNIFCQWNTCLFYWISVLCFFIFNINLVEFKSLLLKQFFIDWQIFNVLFLEQFCLILAKEINTKFPIFFGKWSIAFGSKFVVNIF